MRLARKLLRRRRSTAPAMPLNAPATAPRRSGGPHSKGARAFQVLQLPRRRDLTLGRRAARQLIEPPELSLGRPPELVYGAIDHRSNVARIVVDRDRLEAANPRFEHTVLVRHAEVAAAHIAQMDVDARDPRRESIETVRHGPCDPRGKILADSDAVVRAHEHLHGSSLDLTALHGERKPFPFDGESQRAFRQDARSRQGSRSAKPPAAGSRAAGPSRSARGRAGSPRSRQPPTGAAPRDCGPRAG